MNKKIMILFMMSMLLLIFVSFVNAACDGCIDSNNVCYGIGTAIATSNAYTECVSKSTYSCPNDLPCADAIDCYELGAGGTGFWAVCPPCVAKTCPELGVQCGIQDNRCNGVIDCGGCPSEKTCVEGQCVSGGCTPKTCAGLGFNCGTAGDGCSASLNCGACSGGLTCINNVCGGSTCKAYEELSDVSIVSMVRSCRLSFAKLITNDGMKEFYSDYTSEILIGAGAIILSLGFIIYKRKMVKK